MPREECSKTAQWNLQHHDECPGCNGTEGQERHKSEAWAHVAGPECAYKHIHRHMDVFTVLTFHPEGKEYLK